MTTDVKRTHSIYLSTKNQDATDSTHSVFFDIPDAVIRLDNAVEENIKVSLVHFRFDSDWSEINSTNNEFSVDVNGTVVNIVIPPANYPFVDLARLITTYAGGVFQCMWDRYSNKLIFSNPTSQNMTLTFTNQSWLILGFYASDNGITGTTIMSSTALIPRQNKTLFMKLDNATIGDGNLSYSSLNSRQLEPTTILGAIPVRTSPYQTQHEDLSVLGERCALYLSNEKLNNLSLKIVTEDNEPATFISHWFCIIKVEVVYAVNPDLRKMSVDIAQLRETMNRLLTLKVISGTQRNMF